MEAHRIMPHITPPQNALMGRKVAGVAVLPDVAAVSPAEQQPGHRRFGRGSIRPAQASPEKCQARMSAPKASCRVVKRADRWSRCAKLVDADTQCYDK